MSDSKRVSCRSQEPRLCFVGGGMMPRGNRSRVPEMINQDVQLRTYHPLQTLSDNVNHSRCFDSLPLTSSYSDPSSSDLIVRCSFGVPVSIHPANPPGQMQASTDSKARTVDSSDLPPWTSARLSHTSTHCLRPFVANTKPWPRLDCTPEVIGCS